jgi:hypothetical protein
MTTNTPPVVNKSELAAHLLGMSLQDFLDRKELLMRQIEQVKQALHEAVQGN